MRMTKRKRDIFIVIESINNWFKANEHYTNPTEDHEGVPSYPEPISDPVGSVTVNDWAAECLEPSNDTEPWDEVNHVASNCPSDNTGRVEGSIRGGR